MTRNLEHDPFTVKELEQKKVLFLEFMSNFDMTAICTCDVNCLEPETCVFAYDPFNINGKCLWNR